MEFLTPKTLKNTAFCVVCAFCASLTSPIIARVEASKKVRNRNAVIAGIAVAAGTAIAINNHKKAKKKAEAEKAQQQAEAQKAEEQAKAEQQNQETTESNEAAATSETSEAPIYCTNCGKKLQDDANFCSNCGKKVDK